MLELDSVLYVGGVPKDMYTSLPVGVLSRQGFEGCMSSLDLPGESPSLIEDAVVPSSSLVSGCEGTILTSCLFYHNDLSLQRIWWKILAELLLLY